VYVFFTFSTHAICPAHHTLLALIIIITFGYDYKLRSPLLFSFVHSSSQSISSQNAPLNTMFSNTLILWDKAPKGVKILTVVFCCNAAWTWKYIKMFGTNELLPSSGLKNRKWYHSTSNFFLQIR
jgi:hypothetical protein